MIAIQFIGISAQPCPDQTAFDLCEVAGLVSRESHAPFHGLPRMTNSRAEEDRRCYFSFKSPMQASEEATYMLMCCLHVRVRWSVGHYVTKPS